MQFDDFHDAVGLALEANVDPARLRWMLTPAALVLLRKLKATDGRYLLQPDPTENAVMRLLGYPVTVSTRIPTDEDGTSIVLWDPSQVAVARDTAPSVTLLTETFAHYDELALRVVARYDVTPLNPEAVVVMRGIAV